MHRTQTQPARFASIVRNTIRRPLAKLAVVAAASSALLTVAAANAAPPSSYFGRPSISVGQNLQQQLNGIKRTFAVPQVAQSQGRPQLGNSWYVAPQAAPSVRATPYYPAQGSGYHNHGHVLHIHELGFDAVENHHHGLRIVQVSWHGVASDIGLEPGDVIYQINGHSVCSEHDVRHAIRHAHHGDLEFVFRDVRTGRTKVRTACLH